MAELPTSPFDFLLHIFCWVTGSSSHPFLISTETGPCEVASLYLRNQICSPYWHWKSKRKEELFLTSRVFSEWSRSFLFHQRPQNKAGSDRPLWTGEILGTDAAWHTTRCYPGGEFPPVYFPGFVSLFCGRIVHPLHSSQGWAGEASGSKLINSR